MKIEIYKATDTEWFIQSDDIWTTHEEIITYLNMDPDEFYNILIQNGAYTQFHNHCFKCEADAEAAMKDLEPYLILAQLTQLN